MGDSQGSLFPYFKDIWKVPGQRSSETTGASGRPYVDHRG